MSGIFGKKIPRHPFFVKKEKNLSKFYKKYKKNTCFYSKNILLYILDELTIYFCEIWRIS